MLIVFALISNIVCAAVTEDHTDDHDHHKRDRDGTRFHTNREGLKLDLPTEDDSFFFLVYGDRTGGPADGVKVLAQAVEDSNLLEPDLVMTVGDLVEGYNSHDPWMEQMREFKGIMDQLHCPWFPVAGNHDIYWRGPGGTERQHEANYEMHFGPLWYAFEHKDCWFIVLYSDEGNPLTKEKSISKPASQRMSQAQLEWLEETLGQAADAKHVFVFLHHPRWLKGKYGDDWERVHEKLAAAGNVRAVFAGHIHYMRYDGPRDGIEYVTLATVGGGQTSAVPEAGFLHQYHVVTVRPDRIGLAAVPVGDLMDVRAITGDVSAETKRLANLSPVFGSDIDIKIDGVVDHVLTVDVENPVSRAIDITLIPESNDSRWSFGPDHRHAVIQPGETESFVFGIHRGLDEIDQTFRRVSFRASIDYLGPTRRFTIPEQTWHAPLRPSLSKPSVPPDERVLVVDGRDDVLAVESPYINVPDGPLTLECWFNAASFQSRTGLVTKTENSEYGFFVNNGHPSFIVLLDGSYADVHANDIALEENRWYHIAGVYDGNEVRLYLDGKCVGRETRSGARRTNELPLYVGADVDRNGNPTSFFHGMIDAVRVSRIARYAADSFVPDRRHRADEFTSLLLNMDTFIGPWCFDESSGGAHATRSGSPLVQSVGE